MTVLSHKVTYQGYPCRAVQFRRSDGLSPEAGYVEINIKDLKQLQVNVPAVLWRNQQGNQEIPGQMGIDQARRLFSGQMVARGTQGQGGSSGGNVGGGLNLFGDLVLESFAGGSSLGKLVYKDIYVAFEGIEEVTEKLASAKSHSEGFVRIPLTDIREFYNDVGLLFQDINSRTRNGNYDPASIKTGGPWDLTEVGPYLFSQLPGSPPVHPKSDMMSMGGNPPGEIIGRGEPAVGFLQELLNQFALMPKMQPDGSYAVMKKWATTVKPGQYSSSVGSSSTWQYLKTEKKSISATNRPCLVCVKGKRRVQRITLDYDPVVQWTDGRFYHLNDIDVLTSGAYDITRVNLQVLNNEGKNFQDILARAPTLADGNQWMKILRKWAYKGYAPAACLKVVPNNFPTAQPPKPQVSSGTVSVFAQPPPPPPTQAAKKNVRVLMDEDEDFVAFLPATEAPWYKGEIGLQGLDMLSKGKASQKNSGGDFDGLILLPPIVKARGIGEQLFTDASEIQSYFQRVADKYGKDKDTLRVKLANAEDRVNSLTQQLNSAEVNLEVAMKKKGITSNPPPDVDEGGSNFLDQAINSLKSGANSIGGRFATKGDLQRWQDDYSNNQSIKSALDQAKKDRDAWKDASAAADKALQSILNGPIQGYAAVYAAYRGFMGIGNLPTAVIEQGKYSFDRRSGVTLFAEPMCVGRSPLVMANESNVVIADGGVSVTFGYELHYNDVNDWTTIYVAPKGSGGGTAKATIVGTSRPSGVKAKLERMPDLTMYLDEYGRPMNITFCGDAALRKAQFQVSQPDSVVGYESIYHGFVPCVLDAGINSVMHSWAGGKSAAFTHVFQNYPGGVGPLGPAMTPTQGAAEMRAKFRAAMTELKDRGK